MWQTFLEGKVFSFQGERASNTPLEVSSLTMIKMLFRGVGEGRERKREKGLHRIVCKLQSASVADKKMLEAGNLFPGRGLLCHLGG